MMNERKNVYRRQLLLVTVTALLLAVMSPCVFADLNSSLVAYYTFDNTGADSHTNSYNANTVAGVSYNASGCVIGGCYYWDGGTGDYITLPAATVRARPSGTLNIWFKFENFFQTHLLNSGYLCCILIIFSFNCKS